MTQYTMEDVRNAARDGRLIELIKMYRAVSGLGLKEAKDGIEDCVDFHAVGQDRQFNITKLIRRFGDYDSRFKVQAYSYDAFGKDEFMQMIEEAIDNGEKLQCADMLDAVMTLCNNIERKGGLYEIAMEREAFLDAI